MFSESHKRRARNLPSRRRDRPRRRVVACARSRPQRDHGLGERSRRPRRSRRMGMVSECHRPRAKNDSVAAIASSRSSQAACGVARSRPQRDHGSAERPRRSPHMTGSVARSLAGARLLDLRPRRFHFFERRIVHRAALLLEVFFNRGKSLTELGIRLPQR